MATRAKRWVALAVVAVGVAACGSARTAGPAASTTTTAAATSTSRPSTTTTGASATTARPPTTTSTTTSAAAACSAVRLSPQVAPEAGLPAPAAAMRADLARAAATCDWGLLATLADRNGAGVSYTFGPVGDPIAFWREADENGHSLPPMFALRTLLGLPYGTQALSDGRVQYVWPAAFAAEHPTDAQLQEIADAGLYPLATLQEWRATGNNYLGYRVIVTATGDWTAFVAGD